MYAVLTRCCVAGLVVGLAAGDVCAESTSKPDYQGTGVIVSLLPPPSSLHATRPVVVLDHDPLVGLMDEKMSMPFIAASVDLFKGVKPGDRVEFGLKVTKDALLVISLKRVAPAPAR